MMQRQIRTSLAHAVSQLPHMPFDAIASPPVQKMCVHDAITCQNGKFCVKAVSRRWIVAVASCVLFLVAGVFGYQQHLMVDSYITIDVNPSFEITANRHDRVLEVKALDDEAIEFVEGKKFRGKTVDDAVEALFVQLGSSHYITAEKRTVLISVHSKNAEHGSQIEKEMTKRIEKALAAVGIKPHVVYQPFDGDAKKRQEARSHHTSAGKLQMAQFIKANMQDYSLEQLIAMPMWQLYELFDDADDTAYSDDNDMDSDDSDDENADSDMDFDDDGSDPDKNDSTYESEDTDTESNDHDDDPVLPRPVSAVVRPDRHDDVDSEEAEEIEKNSGEMEEIEKSSGEAEEIEKSSGEAEEIEKSSGEAEEIEKSSGETEEIEKSSGETEEIEKSSGETEEVEKSSEETEEIEKSSEEAEIEDSLFS